MILHKQTDIVIVGSGPGGATLARQICRSKAGLGVTLLERGRDWRQNPMYGTYAGVLAYSDKATFLRTQEGLSIIRPLMLGGATGMYCGCSAMPLPWWRDQYDIDLDAYAAETVTELGIAPLPPELRGAASTRIAEAAGELGLAWQPQDKFLQPDRSPDFDCRATCMLGCRCGAKWNAAEYIDEAVLEGLDLWTGARVDRVLHDGTAVIGVSGHRGRQAFTIEAGTVILAAGGLGSPRILRASGFSEAGQGLTLDVTSMVYGLSSQAGLGDEPPMTWSYPEDEIGAMFSTLIDPWLNYPVIMLSKGPNYALTWPRWGRTLGVMIKLKDEISGHIDDRGRISKGLTAADNRRQERAEEIARSILNQAGCDPETIFTTPLRGTHPSGTVRVDAMLSRDLETTVRGLYVCDASVFPQALARPTVLTIISLAKRLADHVIAPYRPAMPRKKARLAWRR